MVKGVGPGEGLHGRGGGDEDGRGSRTVMLRILERRALMSMFRLIV